ncbi:hypothetical protein DPMN_029925 [Dreissena polymorpha]|uniref:Uncharacterized protein n=1 Tax=Dreissena polymorpha TaxID=45954 RepID=A0A9D4M050_DREPO|nr:hypothetical protein DPMN_029925 [Dreissena polymorpha]
MLPLPLNGHTSRREYSSCARDDEHDTERLAPATPGHKEHPVRGQKHGTADQDVNVEHVIQLVQASVPREQHGRRQYQNKADHLDQNGDDNLWSK